MDRKKITAYLVGCKENEFMVYREEGELGSVAVGPDGKKYRFSIEQLEKGEIAMGMDETLAQAAAERQPKPKAKAAAPAKPKAEPAKRSRATTTKRKAPAKRKTSTKTSTKE